MNHGDLSKGADWDYERLSGNKHSKLSLKNYAEVSDVSFNGLSTVDFFEYPFGGMPSSHLRQSPPYTSLKYIPVAFHITESCNHRGPTISKENALDIIKHMNTNFIKNYMHLYALDKQEALNANPFRFFIKDITFFDKNVLPECKTVFERDSKPNLQGTAYSKANITRALTKRFIDDVINIYVVDGGGKGGGFAPRIRSKWNLSKPAIFIYSDDISSLQHELGHFFRVPHTFNTTEQAVRSNKNSYKKECHKTGDLFCDTAPDIEPITDEDKKVLYYFGYKNPHSFEEKEQKQCFIIKDEQIYPFYPTENLNINNGTKNALKIPPYTNLMSYYVLTKEDKALEKMPDWNHFEYKCPEFFTKEQLEFMTDNLHLFTDKKRGKKITDLITNVFPNPISLINNNQLTVEVKFKAPHEDSLQSIGNDDINFKLRLSDTMGRTYFTSSSLPPIHKQTILGTIQDSFDRNFIYKFNVYLPQDLKSGIHTINIIDHTGLISGVGKFNVQ